jgi:biotin carboxyl carrier protein
VTVEVEIAGRLRTVRTEAAGSSGLFRVRVDDRDYEVAAVRTSPVGLLLSTARPRSVSPGKNAPFPADNRVWEVFVTPAGTDVLVNVHGRTVSATLNGRRTGRGADLARQTQGEARIVAPMPGRIVRVLVGVGDHVAIRQPLVVVEAMKMENELRAPKAGRVKDVSATAGASVEAGRVLLVID